MQLQLVSALHLEMHALSVEGVTGCESISSPPWPLYEFAPSYKLYPFGTSGAGINLSRYLEFQLLSPVAVEDAIARRQAIDPQLLSGQVGATAINERVHSAIIRTRES